MSSALPQNTPEIADTDSTWSNAPKLSRKVRELAHRSYHALKAPSPPAAQTGPISKEVLQDLRDLCDQIARLQHKIHTRNLSALIPWVDALRRQVDVRLGQSGKADD
jgi:hypothetical protein